ncbi:MAG: sugar transferase [Oscillospiraceae bacterium]
MYIKRNTKYFSYIYLIDIFSLSIAFLASSLFYFSRLPDGSSYSGLYIMLVVIGLLVDVLTDNLHDFFIRGYYLEFSYIVKWWCLVVLSALFYLFATKTTATFSRIFFLTFVSLGFVLMYFLRLYFKQNFMHHYRKSDSGTKIAIVTTSQRLGDITNAILEQKNRDYYVSNIVLVDGDYSGEDHDGFKITANLDNMFDVLRSEVLDEVFINVGTDYPALEDILTSFQSMGTTVHLALDNLGISLPNARTEQFIGYHVLTSSNNEISHAMLLQKRAVDLVGGVVGLFLTAIISIFLIPAICIESKGSPFYSQVRVGRNGRRFKMYKFRSMYPDADARKAQLMNDNKMQGFMFKMDNDPRITKVGKFIRKTSLDEFPQFWNVFTGDMSLVGTRPPTVDEFEKYSPHHKSRLSFKPGITGLWQVSGRSEITDFEEVVALDRQYIENRILFKTVKKVISGEGAE